MIDIRKTTTRVDALDRVRRGLVRYTARTGTFSEDGTVITGSQRRTYAELRRVGAITSPDASDGAGGEDLVMTLTKDGEALRQQWVD